MATIVEHRTNGERYLLLGTGFGAFKALKPNAFFGNWLADEEAGEYSMIAVSNAVGEIGWFESTDLFVVSIDGQHPGQLIAG